MVFLARETNLHRHGHEWDLWWIRVAATENEEGKDDRRSSKPGRRD